MKNQKSSYTQIVKSTSIFGGVQVVNIILGIIRQKVIAVLLGPVGVGLISVYQSVINLVKSITTLGLDTAGVKDIAENADNIELQSRKILVFKFWIMLTACFGALICLVFCYPISVFAFEDGSHTLHIALLSVCVFLTSLSTGQSVIMQGTRNIAYMAKASLWGNVVGLIVSLSFFFFFGIEGIIPSFIVGSLILLLFTSFYAHKIRLPKVKVSNFVALKQGQAILKLGFFIVSVSIMEELSMLIVKSYLTRKLGIEAVGLIQPAWTMSVSYLALLLKSMGTDFFPRLCLVANNPSKIRKLVNEQTHIALLVATPIIVIMMLFSSVILPLLFSKEFIAGTSVLQWHIVGSFFKVLSWPLAFILLAKGRGLHYLLIEIVYFLVYLLGSYFLFPYLNIVSVGVAYLLSYVAYLIVLYIYAFKTSKFRWSMQNLKICFLSFIFISMSIFIIIYLPDYLLSLGIVISLSCVLCSLYLFNKVFNLIELFNKIKDKVSHKK